MTTTFEQPSAHPPALTWTKGPAGVVIDEGDCELRLQAAGARAIWVSVRTDRAAAAPRIQFVEAVTGEAIQVWRAG